MKKSISRVAAFKLVRKVNESAETKIKLYKKEEAEEGEVYAVVTPDGGDATVTFQNGEMLVGPFTSPEAAQELVGDDVQVVTCCDGEIVPEEQTPEDEVLVDDEMKTETKGKKTVSNLMRMRKQVAESIRKQVKADILRESEALDVDTDVKDDDASTEDAAGALDDQGGAIASFINDQDLGPNEQDTGADQDPAADDSDENILEARAGQLVNVFERKTGQKVDTGLVESVNNGVVMISESDSYSAKEYKFQVLAS